MAEITRGDTISMEIKFPQSPATMAEISRGNLVSMETKFPQSPATMNLPEEEEDIFLTAIVRNAIDTVWNQHGVGLKQDTMIVGDVSHQCLPTLSDNKYIPSITDVVITTLMVSLEKALLENQEELVKMFHMKGTVCSKEIYDDMRKKFLQHGVFHKENLTRILNQYVTYDIHRNTLSLRNLPTRDWCSYEYQIQRYMFTVGLVDSMRSALTKTVRETPPSTAIRETPSHPAPTVRETPPVTRSIPAVTPSPATRESESPQWVVVFVILLIIVIIIALVIWYNKRKKASISGY